jgi:hypothetical protein
MSNGPDVMPKGKVLAFGIYLIVLNLALLYILLGIWPDTTVSPPPTEVALGGGLHFNVPLEIRYLLIVVVAGALGSYIHLATSFADYVGNRQLVWSWGWWYALRPFIGMALALLIYFLIRGGLVLPNGNGTVATLSPHGIAAIAGMCGMFSKQATDKLREVFENFFQIEHPPERRDELKSPERSAQPEGQPALGGPSAVPTSGEQQASS